jgi:hypothetical protein
MIVADEYPPGAARGSDYFTGAPLGSVIERRRDGDHVHPEQVVITDIDLDYEGTICIGERTVRHWAHLFGLVDAWAVDDLREAYIAVAAERDQLSAQLVEAGKTIELLRSLEPGETKLVYVAADGTEHRSAKAAASATRRSLPLPDPVVASAAQPVDDPFEAAR